jgi:hypothetical protein
VPIQDYRKQGLIRGEQYRVVAVNPEAQQVVLETPSGSVLSINPAACPAQDGVHDAIDSGGGGRSPQVDTQQPQSRNPQWAGVCGDGA